MKLLGLSPEDRPSQLVEKTFETAVPLGERDDLGAQPLDDASGASLLETAIALADRSVLSMEPLSA